MKDLDDISADSAELLSELFESDNPTQTLCDQVNSKKENAQDELRDRIKELCDFEYITVRWASNMPYTVRVTKKGKEFIEEMNQDNISYDEKKKLEALIKLGEKALNEDYHESTSGSGLFFPSMMSGETYEFWMNGTKIFADRYLSSHPLYNEIENISKKKDHSHRSATNLLSLLKSVYDDNDFWEDIEKSDYQQENSNNMSQSADKKVFIVHGHDEAAKYEVARTLEHAGFEPVILHEQSNTGKTIIEKIEKFTDVSYAVVLYTPCDKGMKTDGDPSIDLKPRARQNVVFEHGYLIGKLGRDHVAALVKDGVETPGDISGVVYIPMDDNGGWKLKLAKEMKAVGLNIDLNQWM